jgi:hypothetical protein
MAGDAQDRSRRKTLAMLRAAYGVDATSPAHSHQGKGGCYGYTPDVIVLERGKPARLNFVRQESASCSEMVLIPAFNKSAQLPEGETVAVEFMPAEAGEYEFACQMGMLRGKLIVE